jgi:hypothetical protein
MKNIFAVLFFVASTFSFVFAEVDLRVYPTEFEFEVYEYYAGTLDVVVNLGERNAQDKVARMTAEKFDISANDLDNIQNKFSALESELLKKDPGYEKGGLITYRWKKVKKLIDEIGWEEILRGVGQ